MTEHYSFIQAVLLLSVRKGSPPFNSISEEGGVSGGACQSVTDQRPVLKNTASDCTADCFHAMSVTTSEVFRDGLFQLVLLLNESLSSQK